MLGTLPGAAVEASETDEASQAQVAPGLGWRRVPAREWLGLASLCALGVALRLLLAWQQSRSGVVIPLSDEEEYFRGAVHLYKDLSYYDHGQWLRAPLPSAFLALCFWVVGAVDLWPALAIQAAASGLLVLPVAATARSLFASRRAGLVAGALAAGYLPFALLAGQLMSEALAVLLVALWLWAFERWRASGGHRWLFVLGLALAAFTLTRAIGFYAQALLLLAILWRPPAWRPALKGALVFLLGFWLLVGPWAVRNTRLYDRLVLVDTNAGFSFWNGTVEPEGHVQLQTLWNRTIANPAEREARYMQRALENIQRDPAGWLLAGRYKVASLWQLRVRNMIANNLTSLAPALASAPLTLAGDLQYLLLVLCSLATLCFVARRDFNWMLLLWPLYGTLMAAISMGHPRLRVPLEVPLLVLAAYPLAHPRGLWQLVRAAGWPRRLGFGAALLGAAGLLYASVYLPFARSQLLLAQAELAWQRGDSAGSIAAAERAVAAQPGSALPLVALAWRQSALADAQASATWERVLALDPHIVLAHAYLIGDALSRQDPALLERRMQGVRAIARDDNALYAWLWERFPRATASLELGSDQELGQIVGFGAPQREGETRYRWTSAPEAQVRLPAGPAASLALSLRGWREGQLLSVAAGDQLLGVCQAGASWSECRLQLPPAEAERMLSLSSPIDLPWPPVDYLPRGVALARIELIE